MSMYSVIGGGDDQPTPASPAAAPDGATPGGGAATPPVALSPLLPPPQMVVLALDATRDHREEEIRIALRAVVTRGDILRGGDSLLVLAVLHAITNPSEGHAPLSFPTVGYQTKACTDSFAGTNLRFLGDQVKAKAEFYRNKLRHDVEELHKVGINVTLKVSPGSPAKFVIIHEVNSSKAAWVVLDRHFRRDFKYLEKHIACKVAVFQDNLVVQPLKIIRTIPSSKKIQAATSDFSNENLLGEGGFGHVYKGQLNDGQIIAAKLRKEASSQGYTEFFSEVQVLSFARHRNIVMLLGTVDLHH
ncbi:hypothetical protein E2562_036189 [Oryza meyeriana var. granulata]|uniref:Protein kinase domain-containing protein n=1 Tax=Oryza meyeriana var. granulata TaxID=110450 RepID=A0A6G1E7Z0_9ORYZ|nr:hypothetical protein E2562_036189 [Oryza meyeriana var. granulata]